MIKLAFRMRRWNGSSTKYLKGNPAPMEFFGSIGSVLGRIYIICDDDAITGISIAEKPPAHTVERETDLISEAKAQLGEYLDGRRKMFDLPYEQKGTPFQESVWSALSEIGYGRTRTYGEIAEAIGHPNAYRAVGSACGRNSLPMIVPCHRAVSSSGIGGFFCGLEVKRKLMAIEGIVI